MAELNLKEMEYSELDNLRVDILMELQRRRTLEEAEQKMEELNSQYARAIGRQDGCEWVQPKGAHDAYKMNDRVIHNGKTWVSTTQLNVWEPGVSGWREEASEDPETGETTIPDFLQPTGAHDAYKIGDKVTFNGSVYESLIDANVWSPDAYPQGWKKI